MKKISYTKGESKMQSDNTKTPPKCSIADLGRSVRVTTATELVWLKLVYGIPTFPLTAKAMQSKGHTAQFDNALEAG